MAKKGRPSKGERDFIGLRPSAELGALVRQYAADHGLSITHAGKRCESGPFGLNLKPAFLSQNFT